MVSTIIPGNGARCKSNSQLIAQHKVMLNSMDKRLDRIEIKQDKLFEGNARIAEISAMIKILAARGGVDQNQIENIIHRKMDARDDKKVTDKRWYKAHRIEILSVLTTICTATLVVMKYLEG